MKKCLVLLLTLCCASCHKQSLLPKEKESWLFVIHSRNAQISEKQLVLQDVDPSVLAFTDRPIRKTAMLEYADFVANWPLAFDYKNPNATVSYFDKEGNYHGDVVELIDPKVVGETIVFGIKAIDNATIETKKDLGETAVFIDGGVSIGKEKAIINQIDGNSASFPSQRGSRMQRGSSSQRGSNMQSRSSSQRQGDYGYGSSDDEMQCSEMRCKAPEASMDMEEDKECQMPSCKPKVEEPMDMDEDKECQMPTCKPKVEEPMDMDEDKECQMPTCKPKVEEPMDMEEDKECQMPSCTRY